MFLCSKLISDNKNNGLKYISIVTFGGLKG